MKKILFSFLILAAAVLVQNAYGQVCTPGNVKRWDGTGAPGDQGLGQAGTGGTNLFAINGNILDWTEHITGALNATYAGATPPTYQPDPFASPISGPNVQQDGLKAAVVPNYDRDRPAQDHRDLRYFAFTYDRANTYFFFRRPANNNSQVTFFYMVDINLDGFMRNGEPIIKIVYNGSSASIEMGYFTENTSLINDGTSAPGSWILNKGNSMVATVSRAGGSSSGNSEWTVGAADGWSMQGSYATAAAGQLPALGTVSGISETFAAAAITDGPNTGYAVEFAVPWNYLRLYDGAGAAPLPYDATYNPMVYTRVFSWHVSLNNGNSSDLNGAEDNAGGCCSGLAFSGNANTDLASQSTTEIAFRQKFRTKLAYTDVTNATTNVIMPSVQISNITQFGPVPPVPATDYTVTVFPADASGNPIGAGTIYPHSSTVAGVSTFTGGPVIVSTGAPLGTARFVVDVDFGTLYRTKSATITYSTSNEFAVTSTNCTQSGSTVDNIINIITTTLPVSFTSITATRNHSNVIVKWETATELNNSGFYVERNSNGTWETVGFVASQAVNGTSQGALSYQFVDANNTKGVTQYRIRQVDFDNKTRYSDIRMVRGENQLGQVIVYPNPSSDGKINIVFEDQSATRDVAVVDMAGRTIKQVRGITNNNITIDNLASGVYSIRIVVPATGDQVVEKVVVSKR